MTRLVLGDLQANCYIVEDGEGGAPLLIDPADEAEVILDALDGVRPELIVLTHRHFDHLTAAAAVAEATGAPVAMHPDDLEDMSGEIGTGDKLFGYEVPSPRVDRLLGDGDRLEAGSVVATVLHTPGHSRGSVSLLCGGELFCGDTVFYGSVGRTDFPGGDGHALARSIAEKIAPLPDETVIHPGHGPDTTVGHEKRLNPFFP